MGIENASKALVVVLSSFAFFPCGINAQDIPGQANNSKSPSEQRAVPNDRLNYIGDVVYPRFPGTFQLSRFKNGVLELGDQVCITKDAVLQGKGEVSGDSKNFSLFEVDSNEGHADSCGPGEPSVKLAVKGEMIAISDDTLSIFPFNRRGFAYGTLVIPFKYQVGGDKSFSNETSLGGYIGYRIDTLASTGTSIQIGLFAGATSIKVSQIVEEEPIEQSLTGFSYGLALLAEFKKDFQIGFVVGADKIAKSANYVNNNKPWIAFSIGFDFAR